MDTLLQIPKYILLNMDKYEGIRGTCDAMTSRSTAGSSKVGSVFSVQVGLFKSCSLYDPNDPAADRGARSHAPPGDPVKDYLFCT